MVVNFEKAVKKMTKNLGIEVRLDEALVLDVWNSKLASMIPVKTRAMSFKSGTLYIMVEDPTWCQELTLMKGTLIKRVNFCFKKKTLKDIRIRCGDVITQTPTFKERDPFSPDISLDVQLGEEEKKIISDESRFIERDELRKKFVELRTMDFLMNRKLKDLGLSRCQLCGAFFEGSDICQECEFLMKDDTVLCTCAHLYDDPTMDYRKIQEFVGRIDRNTFEFAKDVVILQKKKTIISCLKDESSVGVLRKLAFDCVKMKFGEEESDLSLSEKVQMVLGTDISEAIV